MDRFLLGERTDLTVATISKGAIEHSKSAPLIDSSSSGFSFWPSEDTTKPKTESLSCQNINNC